MTNEAQRNTVEPLVRPEVMARFEACVRRRFAEWQAQHPDIHVASSTMPEIQMMLTAMAMDVSELEYGPNAPAHPRAVASRGEAGCSAIPRRVTMNVRECPYVVETAQMCQTLIREVSTALTWADMKTAIDAIDTVRRRSESMIAEWHHLHPDENAGSCKPNVPLTGGQPPEKGSNP